MTAEVRFGIAAAALALLAARGGAGDTPRNRPPSPSAGASASAAPPAGTPVERGASATAPSSTAAQVPPAGASAGGSSATGTPSAAPTSAASPLSLDALKNATYKGLKLLEEPVTLLNGEWRGKPPMPGSTARPHVVFVRDFVRAGDFYGDGSAEAVVLLSESAAGQLALLYDHDGLQDVMLFESRPIAK